MGLLSKLWLSVTRRETRADRMQRVLEDTRTRAEQERLDSSRQADRRGPIRRIFK